MSASWSSLLQLPDVNHPGMIQSVLICGAGTMGRGIALNCITKGFPATLYDPAEKALEQARAYINAQIENLKAKGKLTGLPAAIYFVSSLQNIQADCCIEAIVENMEAKKALFEKLEDNFPYAILCSNTSSLSIHEMAKALKKPEKFSGLHFFNPVPLMKLVEIVKGDQTSEHTIEELKSFTNALGKISVVCKDSPGFIVNRVARPYYLEALYLTEKYSIAKEDIDKLTESAGFRMGPFTLMDLIGIDINYAVSCEVYQALGKPERLKPSPLQEELVKKGQTGRKAGAGFYTYTDK